MVDADLRRLFGGQKPEAAAAPVRARAERRGAAAGRGPEVRPEEAMLIRLMVEHGSPMVEHVLTRMGVDEFTDGPSRAVVRALIAQFEAGAVEAGVVYPGRLRRGRRVLVTDSLAERHGLSGNWASKVGVDAEAAATTSRSRRPRARCGCSSWTASKRPSTALKREIQSTERAGHDIEELQREVGDAQRPPPPDRERRVHGVAAVDRPRPVALGSARPARGGGPGWPPSRPAFVRPRERRRPPAVLPCPTPRGPMAKKTADPDRPRRRNAERRRAARGAP